MPAGGVLPSVLFVVLAAFPRLAMYSGNDPDGVPYLGRDGAIDAKTLAATARFDVVTLDVTPWSEFRPDLLDSLRARNPDIRLLALLRGANSWKGPARDATRAFGDSVTSYWADLHDAIQAIPRGFIMTKRGRYGTCCANVNLANERAARAFADVVTRHVIDTGRWDGVFVDQFCPRVEWELDPADPIDYARAGFADSASFFAAYASGHALVTRLLRERGGAGFELHGNCGPGADGFDAWMVENFPRQNGGTWERNVEIARTGWISIVAPRPYPHADGETWRRLRFALGSACMVEAVAVLVNTEWDRLRGFAPWWADEYAVDARGRASDDKAWAGWLGEPTGAARRLASGVWRRDFRHGLVLVNPTRARVDIDIGPGYRRIRGVRSPAVNDGSAAGPTVSIPPEDALFLWKAAR
jgi:hypothetical protein